MVVPVDIASGIEDYTGDRKGTVAAAAKDMQDGFMTGGIQFEYRSVPPPESIRRAVKVPGRIHDHSSFGIHAIGPAPETIERGFLSRVNPIYDPIIRGATRSSATE